MSRSRRKTSICGWSCADSEKQYKKFCNKRVRLINRLRLKNNYEVFVLPNEVLNVWAMPKDGKQYFNEKTHPNLMRK